MNNDAMVMVAVQTDENTSLVSEETKHARCHTFDLTKDDSSAVPNEYEPGYFDGGRQRISDYSRLHRTSFFCVPLATFN